MHSGSTLLGDLLSCKERCRRIYFNEPISTITDCPSQELAIRETERYFRCDIPHDFYHRSEKLDGEQRTIYDTITFESPSGKTSGITKNVSVMKDMCEKQDYVMVKTVRVRLAWVKSMMQDKDLDLRVVHLVRDPRGVIHSMRHTKGDMRDGQSPATICHQMLQVRSFFFFFFIILARRYGALISFT